ncbi:MAG: L-lysine 6-transaminase [Candidatus Mcinerneyibacterium aminivorans]|uniref:L-lysine-epsilon aminotransferase n=1 Tax=Candidatus Mcinerneyibacterium aminivorans TaxID=2703815 RepID=A0A5D0MI30_9BACT|nr:MAG: L-lysine 6-transaminase [Candidatus Mcinerneyibacterium aminivorans]
MEKVNAKNVHKVLGKHMIADGLDVVYDPLKSEGSYFYDAKRDKKYLDLFSFFASLPISHGHPKVFNEEFKNKLGENAFVKPSNSDIYTKELAEFADTMAELTMPEYMKYQFFISGGALAVENALKVAFDWKARKNKEKGYKNTEDFKVLHFKQAFHGRTGYTLSLTNTFDPRKTQYFPKFDWPRVDNPKAEFPIEDNIEKIKEKEEKVLSKIKKIVAEQKNDIAALIIEPVQGEGGDNHFRSEFMQAIEKICDENEIFFVVDEVQSGMGLTGKWWAHQHYGVTPDALAFGKKSQVCGIFVGEKVDEVENHVFKESSRINSTWGGNLIDMVRAQRYLEIIDEDNLVENAAKMGEKLLEGIKNLDGNISNIRGKGLMIAFDLKDSETRDRYKELLFEEGAIVLGCGEKSIRLRPFLDITEEEVKDALDILQKALNRL